ncbi:MAG: energy coupling factor transporter S component ThiW [Roseburia sp.]|nr:energy coupling factor transporter S component ThiW [Roseburia sp.]
MKINIRKLAVAGMMTALGVVLSTFYIPVGVSKCFPIQHLLNVLAGIFLGPWYALGFSFCTALIRNLMGTGSLLAFPGSMVGAFCCGMLYQHVKKVPVAVAGEVVGTGIIGGMLCYPVARFLMGNAEAALFTYVMPFFISTLGGSALAAILLAALYQSKAVGVLRGILE